MIKCICDYCTKECGDYLTLEDREECESHFCSYDCTILFLVSEFYDNWNDKAFSEWFDRIISKLKEIPKKANDKEVNYEQFFWSVNWGGC